VLRRYLSHKIGSYLAMRGRGVLGFAAAAPTAAVRPSGAASTLRTAEFRGEPRFYYRSNYSHFRSYHSLRKSSSGISSGTVRVAKRPFSSQSSGCMSSTPRAFRTAASLLFARSSLATSSRPFFPINTPSAVRTYASITAQELMSGTLLCAHNPSCLAIHLLRRIDV
jgi:hypothetical protein